MASDNKNRPNSQAMEIVALIDLSDPRQASNQWLKIGTGTENGDGTVTLKFNVWPTNLKELLLRPANSGAADRPTEHDNITLQEH